MGERGPTPKRSDRRLGHTSKEERESVTKAAGARKVAVPRPDPKWHPVARRWFNSLGRSGQAAFYEPSDWGTAFVIAESISRELKPVPIGVDEDGKPVMATLPPKGASLAAWLKGMASLMVTEGDRRRARLELDRPGPPEEAEADVSELSEYRRRLQSG